MNDVVLSAENELVDLEREFEKYIRNDGFWDQLNRGGRLTLVSLLLLAYFFSLLISSMVGLI